MPEAMKENLTELGITDKYSFERPGTQAAVQAVNTFPGVRSMLKDHMVFHTPYSDRVKEVLTGKGDGKAGQFYYSRTVELIKERSYMLSGVPSQSIDIVQKVLNLVLVHFASTALAEFLLKTKKNPHRTYLEHQQILHDIFGYIFKADAAKKMCTQELDLFSTPDHGVLIISLEFIQKLVASKKPKEELANDMLSMVLLTSIEFAQCASW
ncbi:hypothetical protein K439DRAFT_1611957 [Ramaria rubella]|nr:hypothetical protein K439DRAFT_1611957 [Ramaria rubella]